MIYSVSGVKCLRKYYAKARTWVYIPVAVWRRMSVVERQQYRAHSIIQLQAALSGRFGYSN